MQQSLIIFCPSLNYKTTKRRPGERIVRNILSLIFVEFGLFWMFWLYLSYYEGIGMRQLGLPPKNAPNCVVMEQKSEEEESGGVSPPHQHRLTLKSSEVQSLHRVKTPSSPSSRSKKLTKFDRPKCQLSWLSDSWDIYIAQCRLWNLPKHTRNRYLPVIYYYFYSGISIELSNAYYHMPK